MVIDKYEHKVEFVHSSGSSPPNVGGQKTSDIKLWVKVDEYEWFRPYGNFDLSQIVKMIEICHNEYQLVSLMELLSAKKEDRK